MQTLQELLDRLADYVIDAEAQALEEACVQAARDPFDLPALLAGLEAFSAQRGDPARLAHARVRLRTALQLPLTPGAVCKVEP